MDKQSLFNYIMTSPHNTNPNVLSTLINTNSSNNEEKIVITTLSGSETQGNVVLSIDKTYEELANADIALIKVDESIIDNDEDKIISYYLSLYKDENRLITTMGGSNYLIITNSNEVMTVGSLNNENSSDPAPEPEPDPNSGYQIQ